MIEITIQDNVPNFHITSENRSIPIPVAPMSTITYPLTGTGLWRWW